MEERARGERELCKERRWRKGKGGRGTGEHGRK
jgi:hypothetical protein